MANDFGDDFDPTKEKSSSVIPAGKYRLVVAECALETSKAGTFQIVKVVAQVVGGEFQNRQIFCRYNFKWISASAPTDKQKQAVQIGRGQFADLCKAVGLLKPTSCSELVGKLFVGTVKVRKETDEFDAQNELKKCEPASAGVSAPAAVGTAAQGDWSA